MKIEFKNQQFTADIDVKKEWPLMWHRNKKGEKINNLSMAPGKIHLEFSGDITVDTGTLQAIDILKVARAIDKLDKINEKKIMSKLCKEVKEAA